VSKQQNITVFGIDLGTTNSCIAYADEYGKPNIVPNNEGDRTTPSVVLFEDDDRRVVGKEAKNNAVLNPKQTVDMIKRHMGEPGWRFEHNGAEHSAEEISSYILRKLAQDAEQSADITGITVRDVVITCPAYFGIAEREATAQAGELAGFNVREIINEPTAAAIMYGFQNEQDQVVLVYDLGGGTFDITVIEIKGGAITVVATGGDHHLGGRDWDERVVMYLAQQWQQQTGSKSDPTESAETLQDLWFQAERAKHSLSARQEAQVPVSHEGMRKSVLLPRDKFNELTASLLEQTISFTKSTMDEARKRGYSRFDKILLVGGSIKMPQVKERLEKEFKLPLQLLDPDEAVAKGAAIYGQKLVLDQKIQHKIAEFTGANPEQVDVERTPEHIKARAQQEVARDSGMQIGSVKKLSGLSVTNVASHSFGIVSTEKATYKEKISNLVLVNDPLPANKTQTFRTLEDNQETVELRVMENSLTQLMIPDLSAGQEIGKASLPLSPGLPENAPIEVTFELYRDGRLHVIGREPTSNNIIEADIQTSSGLSEAEKQEAKIRSNKVTVS
jgi:molecular chaperone DnaK